MTLGEPARLRLAKVGSTLWVVSGFMPMFGGNAKHAYMCRGRQFTGEFDDCFNDYIPVAEVTAILLVLVTAPVFHRWSLSLFASSPTSRMAQRGGYRYADAPSRLHYLALAGLAWSVWRFFTYPLVLDLMPYFLFWATFALWFAAGSVTGISDRKIAPS